MPVTNAEDPDTQIRPLDRRLVIVWPVVLAGLALLANGYRFNTSDQAIHLTFLHQLMEPGGMSADLVASHMAAHPSLLWALHVPLVALVGWANLDWLYLGIHVGSLVLVFGMLYRIGRQLLRDPWAAFLAPALLVIYKACPAHVFTFEPEVINRTIALPLILWSLSLLLAGRPRRAGAVCGLAFCLHASTGAHMGLALLVAAVWDRAGWKRVLGMLAAMALTSAPLWFQVLSHGGPGSWWVDDEWMHILRWRMPHHLFPWRWPAGVWLAAVFQLGLWLVAARHIADGRVRRRAHAVVVSVMLCGPLLGTLVGGPLPLAPLLGLHLWESWLLLAMLAYLASAALVVALVRRGGVAVVGATVLCALLAAGIEAPLVGRDRPAVFEPLGPSAQQMELVDAIGRAAVPAGNPLLVPPRGYTWLRPWTGRSLFVTSKDGGEAVFDRELALLWRQRLASLCGRDVLDEPPPRDEWKGYRSVGERATTAFDGQSPSALRALAARERAWLLVVPANRPLPGYEPLFEGEAGIVYDMRQPPPPP